MEKLIELLNDYEKLNMCRKFDCFELHTFEDSKGLVDRILEDTVISRRYGFIQWLVDNDKINEFMITEIMINSQRRYTGIDKTTAQRVDNNCSDLLLMLLSIQDNPIEFLISILK